MKKIFFLTMAVIGLSLAATTDAAAQKQPTKKVAVYGTKSSGGNTMQAPTKDEARAKNTKRGSCYVWFDNFTGYYVDIWVEGYYQGRLSPYATSVRIDVWTPGNWTKWTAKTAGGTYSWSNDSYCNDSRQFTINLK